LFDLKLIEDEAHHNGLGQQYAHLNNLQVVTRDRSSNGAKRLWCTLLIPGATDSRENIQASGHLAEKRRRCRALGTVPSITCAATACLFGYGWAC
jgi:pyruvate-formate lyase-activating enzyme